MKYKILETPGNREVKLKETQQPKNQDEAKVIVAKLRAASRKKGDDPPFDYVFVPEKGAATNGSGGAGGTSLRLTEPVRMRMAKFVGHVMMETGRSLTMGDGVGYLLDHYEATKDSFEIPEEEDDGPEAE